jgi:hypothetical protein
MNRTPRLGRRPDPVLWYKKDKKLKHCFHEPVLEDPLWLHLCILFGNGLKISDGEVGIFLCLCPLYSEHWQWNWTYAKSGIWGKNRSLFCLLVSMRFRSDFIHVFRDSFRLQLNGDNVYKINGDFVIWNVKLQEPIVRSWFTTSAL